jgi:ribose transport system substrate-binding protein
MKGFFNKKILYALMMSVIIMALTGCGFFSEEIPKRDENNTGSTFGQKDSQVDKSDNKSMTYQDEDYYMISFLSGLDYWKGCFNGFQDAGKNLGVRTIYVGDVGYNVNKSIQVLEEVIAKKPKGIAIACIDSSSLNDTIEKAINSGINVVTFDSDAPESGRTTFIATGNRAAGAGAAKHMAGLIGGEGQVAVLYSVGLSCAEERLVGFKEYLKNYYPSINVVAEADDKGDQFEASRAIRSVLQKNRNIKGIFCVDGIAGVSAATVVKEISKEGKIHIMGFDCDNTLLDLVSSGKVDATIAQGTYTMGFWSMNVLFNSAHNLSADKFPVFIDTGFEVVTKDKVKAYYARNNLK